MPYTISNFPGPYEVEIKYTVAGLEHIQRINCDVVGTPVAGDDSSTITLVTRDGAGVNLESAVDDYIAIIDGLFDGANTAFSSATLNKYAALSTAKDFITQYSIGLPGTHGNTYVPGAQYTLTFGTQEGNGMRLVLLETVVTSNARIPLPLVTGEIKTLADFVVSTDNWMLARDTSWPIVQQNGASGQNERVWKYRFRN